MLWLLDSGNGGTQLLKIACIIVTVYFGLHHDGVLWSVFYRIGIRRRNIFHYLHTTMEKPVSANMPASVFVQGGTRYWMNSCAPLDLEIPPSGTDVGIPLNELLE
jgi:hypothetical protein